MSHYKAMKTYEKKTKNQAKNVSKSMDAVNALFAQNLTKRLIGRKRKPKIKLTELPPKTETYLTDDSLRLRSEDSFDKILKGEVYNEVKVVKNFIKFNSSESDMSKSREPQLSITFHSPIMTRRRRMKQNAAISDEESKEIIVQHKNSTLEKPVDHNLCIERENRKLDFPSLSYIQLPKINESKVMSQHSQSTSHIESSYDPTFSDLFGEKHTVHSSTPCVVPPLTKLLVPISPISKSNNSNSSKLIKKSYDEIRKWDSNFPTIEAETTPKGPVLRSSNRLVVISDKVRRRKLSTTNNCDPGKMCQDWKLNNQPKVYLKSTDIIDMKKTDQKLISQPKVFLKCDAVSDFKGFTEIEKSQSLQSSNNFEFLLNHQKLQSNGPICKETSPRLKCNLKKSKYKEERKKSGIKLSRNKKMHHSVENLKSLIGSNNDVDTNFRLSSHGNTTDVLKVCEVKHSQKRKSKRCSNYINEKIERKNYGKFGNDELKPFITLRASKVNCVAFNKTTNVNKSSKRKSRKKKVGRCCENILSENQISHSQFMKDKSIIRRSNRNASLINSVYSSDSDSKQIVVNYSTEEISLAKSNENKVQLKNSFSQMEVEELKINRSLTVNLKDFNNFEKMYFCGNHLIESIYKKESCKLQDNVSKDTCDKFLEKSVISISDDDINISQDDSSGVVESSVTDVPDARNVINFKTFPMNYLVEDLTHDAEICLPKLDKINFCERQFENSFSTSRNAAFENGDLKKLQSTSFKENEDFHNTSASLLQSTLLKEKSCVSNNLTQEMTEHRSSRSLNFVIPGKNIFNENYSVDENNKSGVKATSENSKVIILSNILLEFNNTLLTPIDTRKTCENILHDHSYSNSPIANFKQHAHSIPNNYAKKSVQNTQLLENQSQYKSFNASNIVETSLLPLSNKFTNTEKIITRKPISDKSTINRKTIQQKSITLKPGKSYRRSLSMLKRSSLFVEVLKSEMCSKDCFCVQCLFRRKLNHGDSRRSFQIVPASTKETSTDNSILEIYARNNSCYVQEQGLINTELDDSIGNLSLSSKNSVLQQRDSTFPVVTAKDIVLRRCGQTEVLPFEECYPRSILQNCQKIGEGVYGEVFLYRNQNGGTSVMKVIPIEGDLIVNGEKQKKFEEIVSEIVIAMELSNLRNNKKNFTDCFSEVQEIRCTQGSYPDRLLDLWELYDETRGSENDSPQMFPSDQLYIVLELANGGQDLESYIFNNALQVFAVFKQTACALAVAESQLKFEHRDLHWGNILISNVDKNKTLRYRLNGKDIDVDTHGVEVTIIDFTLSRIEFDGVVIFNDLSLDNELFVAKGDYQFEIYRLMQQSNRNEWQHFEPYSNILWLHYILDKAVSSALRYKNSRTKIHREYLGKLKKLEEQILSFPSVVEFVNNNFI